MKNYIIGIALALVLVMGVAAFAEATDPATDSVPAVTEEAAATEEATEAPSEDPAEDEQKALQDALDAYRKAKQDKAVSDLEEELNEYVAAGSMTQEQADLILKNVKERMAAKNGECPNCGYQFSKGGMKGQQGWMGGQRGGMKRGGNMGDQKMQRGQMPGNQQAPNGQAPQMNGQMRGQKMPGNQMSGIAPQM